MGFAREFVNRPQRLWIRRAMFQIHLWVGVFLAIYAILIGVSGSVLVLRQEFQEWSGLNPNYGPMPTTGTPIGFDIAEASVRSQFPGRKVTFLYPPRQENAAYYALTTDGKTPLSVSVHPYTGGILAAVKPTSNWLTWFGQLHYFLLLGRNPGFTLNGIGSALLAVMILSGLVLWWPGIRQWQRAFLVDFAHNWKRINFDLHNVAGFWTLAFTLFWAISGVYLVWPEPFTAAVDKVSKVTLEGARENRIRATENKTGRVENFAAILADAPTRVPNSHIGAIRFPTGNTAPILFYMVQNGKESLSGADFVYYDSATGEHLRTSFRNDPKSLGDWIIWTMRPFHFGTQWGLAVKIIWFVLGLALPLLAITGLLMYWNRYLRKIVLRRPVREEAPALQD